MQPYGHLSRRQVRGGRHGWLRLAVVMITVFASGCGGSGADSPAATQPAAPAPAAQPDERLTDYGLDTTFGTTGAVVIGPQDLSRSQADVRDVVIADDNSALAVGVSGPLVAVGLLIKVDSQGKLDATCGVNGVRVFPTVAGAEKPFFNSIRRDSQGRIYIGGALAFRPFAARLLPGTCEIDAGYGVNGVAFFPDLGFSGTTDSTLEVDDAGYAYLLAYLGGSTYIRRYLPDGTPDRTFGVDGKATLTSPNGFKGNMLAVGRDGALYVGGAIAKRFGATPGVAKLTASGTIDPGYGDQGFAPFEVVSTGTGAVTTLTALADGRVIAAGTTASDIAIPASIPTNDSFIVRLSPTGQLDPSFANAGWVRWDWGFENSNWVSSMLIRRDGRTVLCGHMYANLLQTPRVALVHFTPDGQFAGTGQRAGRAILDTGPRGECRRVVEDSTGRLVVGGTAYPPTGYIMRTRN